MRRSDSIRTRHLGGVVHGQTRLPGPVVVPADQITAGITAPPLISRAEAAARRLVPDDVLAEALGVSRAYVRSQVQLGKIAPVALVHMRRGRALGMRFTPHYALPRC